jgi:hypothetical protein
MRTGQNDVVARSPSLKPQAFEHTSNAFTRIERKAFDAHLIIVDVDVRPSQLAGFGGHMTPSLPDASLHDPKQPVKCPHSSISQFA